MKKKRKSKVVWISNAKSSMELISMSLETWIEECKCDKRRLVATISIRVLRNFQPFPINASAIFIAKFLKRLSKTAIPFQMQFQNDTFTQIFRSIRDFSGFMNAFYSLRVYFGVRLVAFHLLLWKNQQRISEMNANPRI